jgi:uncharacterized glyoxalase superfamily protein PhnB
MTAIKGVIPYIITPDCLNHIEWIKTVFGGELQEIHYADDSKAKVTNCSVNVNGGVIFLGDFGCIPGREEGSAVQGEIHGIMLQVDYTNQSSVDEVWKKATENGAKENMKLKVQSWGDYYGTFRDPWGCEWAVWSCTKGSPKQ